MSKIKETLLRSCHIDKVYQERDNSSLVLNDVSVDIYQGDFTVIMGPSGAGKSTLLYALSGMDSITSGEIYYRDLNIEKLTENKMADLRANEFGFVFQKTHLVSYLTLYENVLVAGYASSYQDKKALQKRTVNLLREMNILSVKDHLPSQVSGGEAQRAAIARAMIHQPGIIFADEPTGALNKANSEQVLDLMSQIHQAGQSILMVTHDLRAAIRGTRLIYIEDGQVMGDKEFSAYQPEHEKQREMELQTWLSSMEW